jgi:hypothetical protein
MLFWVSESLPFPVKEERSFEPEVEKLTGELRKLRSKQLHDM